MLSQLTNTSVLAADTTRSIGLVIAALVCFGALAAIFFNIRNSKAEIGSEVELAANRKPYLPDEELEGKKLDMALTLGLLLLIITVVTLPLYFLGDPGRRENASEGKINTFASRGENLYTEQCSSCHGSVEAGGVAAFTLQTKGGQFIQTVNWRAPALNTVTWRYSEEEILEILNYGRTFSPMPAWGGPGGGPQTSQQLETVYQYLLSVAPTRVEMREQVDAELERSMAALKDENGNWVGVDTETGEFTLNRDPVCVADRAAEIAEAERNLHNLEGRPDVEDEIAEQNAVLDQLGAAIAAEADGSASEGDANFCAEVSLAVGDDGEPAPFYASEGEALFNLGSETGFAGGAYSCARCHTGGSSYGADNLLSHMPVIDEDGETVIPILTPVAGTSTELGQCVLVAPDGSESEFNCNDDNVVKRLGGTVLNEPPAPGCGGTIGPCLEGSETKFEFDDQVAFISLGSNLGQPYGRNGQGSGQMPGFAEMLSRAHIEEIVKYERSLSGSTEDPDSTETAAEDEG
jgi:mono/diheme cytochrome c family protein